MKRGLLTILGILLAGLAGAALALCLFHPRTPAEGWLQKEFSLSNDQAQRVEAMSRDYENTCMQMCDHIRQSNAHLADLLRTSDHMTPEIRAAVADTDQVRTDCRTSMLAHFYQVAALMPESQRPRYLKMVYPLIENPEEMAAHQSLLSGH